METQTTFPTPTVVNAPSVEKLTPNVNQVYSPTNVQQTLTSPTPKPDLSDPFGTYNYYMNSSEIQNAKKALQEDQSQINSVNQALRTTTTALENQNEKAIGGTGASVNLIGRQVGRARDLTSNELQALSEKKMANQAYLDTLMKTGSEMYGIASQERAKTQELIAATGGRAGISYTDTFESAVKKSDKYMEKKAKEDKDKSYKETLKMKLMEFGLSTKGSKGGSINTKAMEKRLANYNKSLLDEAKRSSDLQYAAALEQYNQLKNKASTSGDIFSGWSEEQAFNGV